MKFLPFFIGKRYLFGKKSQNVINIISAISVLGVAVGAGALIVVLSVFNGFDGLIKSLFNTFDPDLRIEAARGKTFVPDSVLFSKVLSCKEITASSKVIEENAIFQYNKRQYIGIIKGVDSLFQKTNGIDTMINEGKFILRERQNNFAVVGYGIAYYLGIGLKLTSPLQIYVPSRNADISSDPQDAFTRKYIFPSGIFSIQQEYDSKYVILPIQFTRELLEYTKEVTAIEIKLNKKMNESQMFDFQQKLQQKIGTTFVIKNRYEQHELLYKIMKSEKWAIFLILCFVLVIASFSIIGSLTMLILDKKADIATLKSMGANNRLILNIFFCEGVLISLIGAISGILLGLIICFVQIKFGIVSFPGDGFLIKNYPVEMQLPDFISVFLTVLLIGSISAWIPAKRIVKKFL